MFFRFCRNDIKTFISLASFVWISSTAVAISGLVKKHKVVWSPLDVEKLMKYTEQYQVMFIFTDDFIRPIKESLIICSPGQVFQCELFIP